VKKHASAIAPANRVIVVMSSLLMWRGRREDVMGLIRCARVVHQEGKRRAMIASRARSNAQVLEGQPVAAHEEDAWAG
jgi:hypothetical protein